MTKNPFNSDNPLAPSEFKLHMAIKKHYDSCFLGTHNPGLKIMHIANEQRDSTQGYFNKMLGVEKGFSDILAGWPKNTGVAEIKLPGKYLTSSQQMFLHWAEHIGWHTGIWRTVKQSHDCLILWGHKAAHNTIIEPDYRNEQKKFADSYDFYQP